MFRIQSSTGPSPRSWTGRLHPPLLSGLLSAVLALALPLGGCSPAGPEGPEGPGSVTFYVGSPGQASAAILPGARASVAGGRPPVEADQIASLQIEVGEIEAHRSGGGGWVSVGLAASVTIDPPTLDAGEVAVMATTALPVGDYDNVRLIPESISVQFLTSSTTTPIVVGNHEFDPAPATHEVELPGGLDTGILIPTAHFSVSEDGGVVLLMWDADATAASVNATGSGMILLRPVFVEADEEVEGGLVGG